jgi:hypothetical protein
MQGENEPTDLVTRSFHKLPLAQQVSFEQLIETPFGDFDIQSVHQLLRLQAVLHIYLLDQVAVRHRPFRTR